MKTKITLFWGLALFSINSIFAQLPVANFTVSDTSGCAPLTVNFTDSSTNSPFDWFWDFGDGNTSTLQNPTHTYNNTGTYNVTLIAVNVLGSDTLLKLAYITVNPSPVANAGIDKIVCVMNPNVTLNPVISNATGCSWSTSGTGTFIPDNVTCDATYVPSAGDTASGAVIITLTTTGNGICLAAVDTMYISYYPGFCGPNIISGYVFNDMDSNCVLDSIDYGLTNRIVKIEPGSFYVSTNQNGYYEIGLDSGSYYISLIDNDPIRHQVCPIVPPGYTISLGQGPDTISNLNFGLSPDIGCSLLSVSFLHFGFRPCFSSFFKISYINEGTETAVNAHIEVELPPEVTATTVSGNPIWNQPPYNSTTWDSQSGNTYIYNLGNVPPQSGGDFYMLIEISCGAVINSTLCVTARIFPGSNCIPIDSIWDKSSISVQGSCVGDSLACFNIINTGDPGTGDMQGTSGYRIYENNVLVYIDTFLLNGGDSIIVCWPANSNTIRLEADQRPGHPGNSHPQDNVEMCGTTPFSLGFITQVQADDLDPFVDIFCARVVASWDPNDKTVLPAGLTSTYHYIDSTALLEYHIRFQNTGTDTAFKVVIKDTLSTYLDITSLKPGVSSHSCVFSILDSNILQWTFDGILLPDSNVNEPASHGFLKFEINQNPGNSIGALIENRAAIYFDFNPPVITNTVFNTIGNIDSLTTKPCSLLSVSLTGINVSCNGISDGSADLTVSGGTPVFSYSWSNGASTEDISAVPAGVYAVSVTDGINCSANASVIINQPSVLSLPTNTTPDSNNTAIGVAWVNVTGGTPPYTYQWNDPALQTTDTAYNLLAGTYNVMVTDNNGCLDSSSVTVSNITGISKNTYENNVRIYPNPITGDITVEVTLPNATPAELRAYSSYGSLQGKYSLKQGFNKINIPESQWASGASLVGLYVNGKQVLVEKVVKN